VGAQRPFGAAKHIERRCSEANRRRCPPDRSRSEGTPSSSERAVRRSKPFWLLFRRLEKVTRRKGGTLSGRYRSNGYVLGPPSKRAKIAAFGSSYRGSSGLQVNPVECPAHCQFGQPHDLLNRQRRVHQWRTVGCQGGISGRPAPTGIACCLQEMGWPVGAIASRLTPTGGSGTSVGDWSAVRPPSLASQLPQGLSEVSQ
jgi:hypothetical protein